MKRLVLLAVMAWMLMAATCGKDDSPTTGGSTTSSKAVTPPPAEENAKATLERSPRHGEMVNVPMVSGDSIQAWVVYPERADKAGVVMVIHEIYGLSDWIRSVADQLAAEGFIAIAPDLISGMGPGGGGTDSVASRDDVVKLVRGLTPEVTRARLDATRRWAMNLPAASAKVATIGFCWGGSRSFEYAAAEPPIEGAVVYYGASPDSATLQRVSAPVLAHYGSDDARVNATIEPAKAVLKDRKIEFKDYVYEGAGHGFLRGQSQREGANLKAAQESWPRTVEFLRKML